MSYYVYGYFEPGKQKPFYIGKGTGNRFTNHLTGQSSSKRVQDKITNIRRKGLEPEVRILQCNLSEEDAYSAEESLISKYGRKGIDIRGVLMNICINSRPPNIRNSDLINHCYSNGDSIEMTDNLLKEVKAFIQDCQLKKKFNALLQSDIGFRFLSATKHMPKSYSIQQRLYHIENGEDEPACEHCGCEVSFKCFTGDNYGYCRFCSVTCRNKSQFGKQASSHKRTKETRNKISKSVSLRHQEGTLNFFKTNNPMKTKKGLQAWRNSKNSS